MLPAGQQATSPALRLQVVLHASGLALVLVVGVVLWNLWSLLAAFRDAMLWALLCSIALRDAKDFLVQQLDRQLQQPRSLPVTTLLVVLLPLHTVVDTVNDIWRWLKRWRRYALDYEQATQDRQGAAATLRGELHAGAGRVPTPEAAPAVPGSWAAASARTEGPLSRQLPSKSRHRRCRTGQVPGTLQKLSQWVGDYTQLGIQAARAKSLQQPRALHHPPVKSLHSQHSLAAVDHAGSRTLFRWLIRACLLYELLQWLQTLANWQVAVQLLLVAVTAAVSLGLLPFMYFDASPLLSSLGRLARQCWKWQTGLLSALDRRAKAALRANLHSFVASGQEGRTVVMSVREALPGRWQNASHAPQAQVFQDAKLLYYSLHGPHECTHGERQELLVDLARHSAALAEAERWNRMKVEEVEKTQESLSGATQRYGEETAQLMSGVSAVALALQDSDLQRSVQRQAGELALRKGQSEAASERYEAALEGVQAAERRLALCAVPSEGDSTALQSKQAILPGAAELGSRLGHAYSHLARLQLGEGLAHLQAIARDCYGVLSQEAGEAAADLSSARRLLSTASEPLVALGKHLSGVLLQSLGSTTAFALTGSVGVVRLGVGFMRLVVQFVLFAVMLNLLLSSTADPLQKAVRVLPIAQSAQDDIAAALSGALRGVFESAAKLAAFHGIFTWLT
eukprot:jgi/Astpho2/8925/fgenesh1_pg.00133_%23_8_t